MKKTIFLSIVLLIIGCLNFVKAQNYSKKNTLTFMSYNVENLYDTIDSPDADDAEFTPQSEKKWDTEKYHTKLKNLAEVISKVNPDELPEMIGLCEVENQTVIEDLIKQESLKSGNYKIVHEESPDARGIDVAFLYKPDEFKYLCHQKIPVNLSGLSEYQVRDIMYIKGVVRKKDTLHIFINHWKSRMGGEDKTEPIRIKTADILRNKVDSLLKINRKADIIIAGDFNDEPTNQSLEKVLFATNNEVDPQFNELYNLLYNKSVSGEGSESFKGKWNMIDNLIVSRNLLNPKSKWKVNTSGGNVFKPDFIMYKNPKTGEMSPARTYGGKNYYGGYSDHLPVYFMLKR